MTKQLKAVIETRKRVEKEAKGNRRFHGWDDNTCPLCLTFPSPGCSGCPMQKFGGCSEFAATFGLGVEEIIPIEYVLSFLIDLEDCYRRMET